MLDGPFRRVVNLLLIGAAHAICVLIFSLEAPV
jgi:hypothetical protein